MLKSRLKSFFKTNEKKEELQIKLSQKIKGKATIALEFQGILNDRLLGFYRSQYSQGGKTKYLATTQFEAADARRAFPCWDEPEAKATFDISITADNKFTAISNMPVKSKKKIAWLQLKETSQKENSHLIWERNYLSLMKNILE